MKISATTVGGGYAIIPQIMIETEKRKWITDHDFLEVLATAQMVPGAMGISVPIIVGFRLRGWPGALISMAASILPPFLIILFAAQFLLSMDQYPVVKNIFAAVRPAVAGLIYAAGWQIWFKKPPKAREWVLLAIGLIVLMVFKISPVAVLLGGLVVGFLVDKLFKEKK